MGTQGINITVLSTPVPFFGTGVSAKPLSTFELGELSRTTRPPAVNNPQSNAEWPIITVANQPIDFSGLNPSAVVHVNFRKEVKPEFLQVLGWFSNNPYADDQPYQEAIFTLTKLMPHGEYSARIFGFLKYLFNEVETEQQLEQRLHFVLPRQGIPFSISPEEATLVAEKWRQRRDKAAHKWPVISAFKIEFRSCVDELTSYVAAEAKKAATIAYQSGGDRRKSFAGVLYDPARRQHGILLDTLGTSQKEIAAILHSLRQFKQSHENEVSVCVQNFPVGSEAYITELNALDLKQKTFIRQQALQAQKIMNALLKPKNEVKEAITSLRFGMHVHQTCATGKAIFTDAQWNFIQGMVKGEKSLTLTEFAEAFSPDSLQAIADKAEHRVRSLEMGHADAQKRLHALEGVQQLISAHEASWSRQAGADALPQNAEHHWGEIKAMRDVIEAGKETGFVSPNARLLKFVKALNEQEAEIRPPVERKDVKPPQQIVPNSLAGLAIAAE